jgi:hypothetical protein
MAEKTYALGDEIEIYCLSCRLNLDGNVAAVYEGEIKQAQCRTCGNFVKYRPPADLQKKRERQIKELMRIQAKKKGRTDLIEETTEAGDEGSGEKTESVAVERWKKLTDDVDSRYARPYDRHRSYSEGVILLHKAHGMGHIESVSEHQMVVLFKEGLVKLSHSEMRDE